MLKNPTIFTNFDVNRINILEVKAVLVIMVMKFVSEMLLKVIEMLLRVTEMLLKVTEMWYVKKAGKFFRRVKKIKILFSSKTSKKILFLRQNNIFPPTQKKMSRLVKKN